MKSNKFWICLLGGLLVLALAVWLLLPRGSGSIANIYQDGVCIHSADLSRVEEAYTLTVTGAVENTVRVEPGRICVEEATCPDQVCVRQGWIADGVAPVVCLPNSLVIRIEDSPGDPPGIDAVAG